MCTRPIDLPINRDASRYTYYEGQIFQTPSELRYSKTNITVPCGKCEECRRTLYSSYLQRSQMESLNAYVYMITLTYDDDHIPHLSFTSENGVVDIYFSDIKHIQDMFKRVRKYSIFEARDFRYCVATEYGTSRFRPHFHILLYVAKLVDDRPTTPYLLERELYSIFRYEWRKNVGSRRVPIYESLFTYHERSFNGKIYKNYDLHYVTNDSQNDSLAVVSASRYLMSYLLKSSEFDQRLIESLDTMRDYMPSDLYRLLNSILKSRLYFSKGFGWSFENGKKVNPSLRYMTMNSYNYHMYKLLRVLPSTYESFSELYDIDMYEEFVSSLFNRLVRYDSFDSLFSSLCSEELIYIAALYKYARSKFSLLARHYHMDVENFSLSIPPVTPYDDNYKSSSVYKYIRRGVDQSLSNGLPFLAFISGDIYIPLCKYYHKYAVSIDDRITLLHNNGYECVDDIVIDESSQSSRQSLSDKNHSSRDVIDVRLSTNPYRDLLKKKSNSFFYLNSLTIFVPTLRSLLLIAKAD